MNRYADDLAKELEHELINILLADHDKGYYEFTLGELRTPLFIKLGRHIADDTTFYEQSHAIHTPTQLGPYWTSNPTSGTPPLALSRAIRGLTDYYEEAVGKGHEPSEDWLVAG